MRSVFLSALFLCLFGTASLAQSLSDWEKAWVDSIDFYKGKKQHQKSLAFCLGLRNQVAAERGLNHENYGYALSLLGENYRRLSKLDSAEYWLKAGLKILERQWGKEHKETALRLNNLGLLYLSKSDLKRADSCIRSALRTRRRLLGEENPFTATSFHNLAQVFMARGQLDSAERYYSQALALRRKILGESHEDVAASLNNLANVKRSQGDFKEATRLLKSALEIRKKLLGAEHPEVGNAYLGLGNVYFESGEYDRTEENYQKAIAICTRAFGPDHTELADIYNNLAGVYYRKSQFFLAEEYFQKALTIKQKDEHPEVETIVAIYTNMSSLATDLGNQQKAIRYNLLALEYGEKLLGRQHPTICSVYSNLGLAYSKIGQTRLAIDYHQKSVAGTIVSSGPEFHELGASYINLGTCYQELGQLNKALEFTNKSLAVWTKAFGTVHPKLADALTNLGYLYEMKGDAKTAEGYYRKAIAMQLKTMGSRHPDVGMNQLSLGLLYMKAGQYAKAEPLFLKNIRNWNNQINQYFPGLSADEKEQLYNQLTFHFQNFGAFALKRAATNPAILGTLWNQQLAVKGLLLSSSQKFKNRLENHKDTLIRARFREWEALTNDIAAYYTSPDSADQAELSGMILEAEKLEKELARKSASFSALTAQKPADWTQIRQKLKPGEAAIEMIRLKKFGLEKQVTDSSDSRLPVVSIAGLTDTIWYAALIIRHDSRFPELVLMKNGNLLEERWIQVYRNHVKVQMEDKTSYNEFWKKLDTRLGPEIRRIYFSPDGVYHSINLNTLQDPATGTYLLENRDIRILTNTKEILTAGLPTGTSNHACLIGNPQFNAGLHPKLPGHQGFPNLNYSLNPFRGEQFAELPGTKVEVENIATYLQKAGWKVDQLTDERALESAVKNAQRPQLLHIATHGFFHADMHPGNILVSTE
ncbi:MAG TPA: tetratricopeptide repeat protein, partial [Catalimonadaceae bacterium]|nr:tetratricopeptide repeat protein [Catalimonadaceae bacterium]